MHICLLWAQPEAPLHAWASQLPQSFNVPTNWQPSQLEVRQLAQSGTHSAAQQFQGHTFAEVSRQRLADLGLPEIFHFPGWTGFLSDGTSCLKEYKSMLKESLVRSSVQTWKTSFLHSSAVRPFLLSQQFPCSAGGRLLEAGALDKLHDADLWEAFRFGLEQAVS